MPYAFDQSLLLRMRLATQAVEASYVRREPKVTLSQLVVLSAIADGEGASQTDLVSRTGIDRSTMADVVRRLHKRGYLSRRRRKSDARTYQVTLTDLGRRALDEGAHIALNIEADLVRLLNSGEGPLLGRCLQILIERCRATAST